jgi:hypothetical protein
VGDLDLRKSRKVPFSSPSFKTSWLCLFPIFFLK